MIELTESHKRRIEEQLNNLGYENVEFQTIDEHPDTNTKMVWFIEDKPDGGWRYELVTLDFSATNAPYMELIS